MNREAECQENIDLKPTRTHCEVKRKFEVDGKREYRWTLMNVSEIPGRPGDIRCPYCHGPVRLHFEGIGEKTVGDHFEHKKTHDRKNCKAGSSFKSGEHKMSLDPVE